MVKCCRDCPNRGCGAYHDKCTRYKEAVEANLQILKAESLEKEKKSMEFIYHINRKKRRQK